MRSVIFTIVLMLGSVNLVFSEEPSGICGSSYLEKETRNGENVYIMKKTIESECKIKNKTYKVEFDVALVNEVFVIHFKFNNNLCIEKNDKIILDFIENDTEIIATLSKKRNCEGVLSAPISFESHELISKKLMDKEIISINAELKGEKINLGFSEFSLANFKMTLFCMNQVYLSKN